MSVFTSIETATRFLEGDDSVTARKIGDIVYVWDREDCCWHAIYDGRHWFSIHNSSAYILDVIAKESADA